MVDWLKGHKRTYTRVDDRMREVVDVLKWKGGCWDLQRSRSILYSLSYTSHTFFLLYLDSFLKEFLSGAYTITFIGLYKLYKRKNFSAREVRVLRRLYKQEKKKPGMQYFMIE